MATQIEKVLYTAKTHTTGGREGAARSSDGQLDVKLSRPGSNAPGTNPEQLFAAGWSACFQGAMARAAGELKIALPSDHFIDAEVDLGTVNDGFQLQARLNIGLPGLNPEKARELVERADQICPYSKLSRGNINVELNLI
ncbi:MAG TPA: organic hydroperoxide resistance protein [Afipia sp.]